MQPIGYSAQPPRSGVPVWIWGVLACGCVVGLLFIVVLPAILFPVFAQARVKARQVACLSNVDSVPDFL